MPGREACLQVDDSRARSTAARNSARGKFSTRPEVHRMSRLDTALSSTLGHVTEVFPEKREHGVSSCHTWPCCHETDCPVCPCGARSARPHRNPMIAGPSRIASRAGYAALAARGLARMTSDQARPRPAVVIITGPTAVGKTDLSIRLAKALDGEIISADSVQVYRQLDVGSDKVRTNRTWTPGGLSTLQPMFRNTAQQTPFLWLAHPLTTQSDSCGSKAGRAPPPHRHPGPPARLLGRHLP